MGNQWWKTTSRLESYNYYINNSTRTTINSFFNKKTQSDFALFIKAAGGTGPEGQWKKYSDFLS